MNRVILCQLAFAASCIQLLPAGDQFTNVRHTIIVQSGEATPAAGNYSPFSFGNVTFNDAHRVAFDAFVIGQSPTSGVFVGDGKSTSTIALGVTPSPAGASFGSVSDPTITRNGAVVFVDGAGEVFRSDGRTIVPLVRIGDPAPGSGIVTVLATHAVNADGVDCVCCWRERRGGYPGNFTRRRDADRDHRTRRYSPAHRRPFHRL